jgi:hypothetical protein
MEQTVVTLLIGAGGGVLCLIWVAGAYLVWRAATGGSSRNPRRARPPQPLVSRAVPENTRRSGSRRERLDPVRVQQELIVELNRTRTILLGWLSVLEAFALGDVWRATALRAELGDINTCDVSLIGDANVIATYQLIVGVLRNQAGRGLPPEVASEVASIRVRLLTALAEQERRLNHDEGPQIAEALAHLDLWGPPRPITEVIIRPPTEAASRTAIADDFDAPASPSPINLPKPAQPAAETTPEQARILVPPSPASGPDLKASAAAADQRVSTRRPSPQPSDEQLAEDKPAAPGKRIASRPSTPASARPRLRALPDPAGLTRAGGGTNAAARGPRPAPPLTATPAKPIPPLTATPAKPTPPPPVGAPTSAVASAGRRTTSAVAKPGGSGPRKPVSRASGPVGPAAMSAKPAGRSDAERSRP